MRSACSVPFSLSTALYHLASWLPFSTISEPSDPLIKLSLLCRNHLQKKHIQTKMQHKHTRKQTNKQINKQTKVTTKFQLLLIHGGETDLVSYVLYVYTCFCLFVCLFVYLFVCLFALYRIVTGMYGATACY